MNLPDMRCNGQIHSRSWTARQLCRIAERLNGVDVFFDIPFDWMRPLPPAAANHLLAVTEVLEQIGARFVLGDGTLLGLFRDGKLICHDTDLDLFCLDPNKALQVTRLLESNGWKLGRRVSIHGDVQIMSFYSEDRTVLDVTFLHLVEGHWLSLAEPHAYLKFPGRFFSSVDHFWWRGKLLPIPGETELFLEFLYGRNWRCPTKSKADWRTEYFGALKPLPESRARFHQRIMNPS